MFLILAFIFDHGFFVTTEFIFGKGITLVAGRVCDENSNHEFTTNFNRFGKFVILVPQCIYKCGHFGHILLAHNHRWALICTNQLFAIDGSTKSLPCNWVYLHGFLLFPTMGNSTMFYLAVTCPCVEEGASWFWLN